MPITATCPGCNQALQVEDRFAGMQGKCPTCGTILTFPKSQPEIFAVAPSPPPPPASVYPAALPGMPSAPAGISFSSAFGGTFSLAGLDPIASITLPIGLFFLGLSALSTMLPWRAAPVSLSGIALADATMLLLLCLMVGGIVGTTFYFKENVRLNAVIGGAFGTFAFFVMIAEMSRASRGGGTGAGLWIGLLSAIGIVAPFLILAVLRPLEWPYLKTLTMPPVVQRYGALGISQIGAFLLGFLYLLITLVS